MGLAELLINPPLFQYMRPHPFVEVIGFRLQGGGSCKGGDRLSPPVDSGQAADMFWRMKDAACGLGTCRACSRSPFGLVNRHG